MLCDRPRGEIGGFSQHNIGLPLFRDLDQIIDDVVGAEPDEHPRDRICVLILGGDFENPRKRSHDVVDGEVAPHRHVVQPLRTHNFRKSGLSSDDHLMTLPRQTLSQRDERNEVSEVWIRGQQHTHV
jgi:hypothetical protein